MGLSSTIIYTSELIVCSTICVPSATRHNIHMYPYVLFAAIYHLKSSPTFSVRPCSSVGRVTEDLIRRSWVRFDSWVLYIILLLLCYCARHHIHHMSRIPFLIRSNPAISNEDRIPLDLLRLCFQSLTISYFELGYFEFPAISNLSFNPYTLNQSRYFELVQNRVQEKTPKRPTKSEVRQTIETLSRSIQFVCC